MKSFKYIAFSLGLMTVGLSSCSDFLDKDPSEWVKINTVDDVIDLLKSSYPEANYQWVSELSSDNVIDNNSPHLPYDKSSKQNLTHYKLTTYDRMDDELFKYEQAVSSTYSTSDSPGSLWGNYYSSISSANYALEAFDRICGTDSTQWDSKEKAARAEALLIRAYDHFMLVNLFCQPYKDEETSKNDLGIAYVTETEHEVQKHYDRGSVTSTYAKIKKDLEEGLSLLSDVNYEMPKYHFNLKAAHAFAARVYLYTRDWNKVIENANYVLGTDDNTIGTQLMDYSIFSDCSTSTDYANAWQNPNLNNNLMLITTYSVMSRRAAGYRYSTNSLALRDIFYHSGPTWTGWRANPTGIVAGFTFYRGDSEYGFFPSKIIEQFEYTNKVSGIGYPHIIVRAFTATELLLERAEAKAMLKDYAGSMNDIVTYDKNRQNFSEKDRTQYFANGGMKEPNDSILSRWYSKATNPNCYENWDFTQQISKTYTVDSMAVICMNAINDMRRFETWFEGLRFFDLKRWGISVTHTEGLESTKYVLEPNDAKWAIEIPWEAISAGAQSSRTKTTHDTREMQNDATNLSKYRVK